MAEDYGISDLLRQIAFYRAGGKPEGERSIDKINTLFSGIGSTAEDITKIAAQRLAIKKAQLESNKLERETTPSVPYQVPTSPEEQDQTVQKIRQMIMQKAGFEPSESQPSPSPLTPPENPLIPELSNVKAPITKTQMLTPAEADTMAQIEQRKAESKLKEAQSKFYTSGGKTLSVGALNPQGQLRARAAGLSLTDEIPIEKFNALNKTDPTDIDLAAERAKRIKEAQNQADIQSGVSLNPDAVDLLAKRVLAGAQDPMGLGQKIRGPVFNRMAEISKENGDTVGEQLSRKASLQADTQELSKIQNQRGIIMSFETTAKKNLDNFLGTVSKVTDTGSPILNVPLRQLQLRAKGDPNMAAFATAGLVAQNEIAKVLQGGMGSLLTNEARQEAEKALNPAGATLNQIKASAEILMKDLENRKIGFEQQIQETQSRIKNAGNSFTENSQGGNTIYAKNKKTGERIQSNDGGKTWQPVQ